MRVGLYILLVFASQVSFAQSSFVKDWDKTYGGALSDFPGSIIQTTSGGFLILGSSKSNISGNKGADNWDPGLTTEDAWIINIDSIGNVLWDRTWGGTGEDNLTYVAFDDNQNFFCAGSSSSSISGNKTVGSNGGSDYWLAKININGTKIWEQSFGGTSSDYLFSVKPASDNGCILGGYSYSDVGGNKRAPSKGFVDYWVVRVDSSGNKLWDKSFGSTNGDYLDHIEPCTDGGFLLSGISNGDSSGDKSQNNRIPGAYNIWIVKIDSAGAKQWDKVFGTSHGNGPGTFLCAADSGFLVGTASFSNVDGDKTQDTKGGDDIWIIKIDLNGNKLWDKDYGGTDEDQIRNLISTSDGGFLVAAESYSPAGADKSDNTTVNPQTWLIKADKYGNKEWDKTLVINGISEYVGGFLETGLNSYILASYTQAETGGYKSQDNVDSSWDYWVMKFHWGLPTGVTKAENMEGSISVYPNPVKNDLYISIHQQDPTVAAIAITNTLGQTIYNQKENNLSPNYTKILDFSYLPSGMYFVSVIVDGVQTVRQVVKE